MKPWPQQWLRTLAALFVALHAPPTSAVRTGLRRAATATAATAAEREADAAAAELLDGRGGGLRRALRAAEEAEAASGTGAAARERVVGSLPPAVAALVQSTGKDPPSEDAILRAVQAFNGLTLEAVGRLDRLRAGCHESLDQSEQRLEQVENTLARLSDEDSGFKADRSEAITGIQEANEQVADMRRKQAAERSQRESQKAALSQELYLRQDDLSVATTLARITACQSATTLLSLSSGIAGNLSSGGRLCRSETGKIYLQFDNPHEEAMLATPRARELLRSALASGPVNGGSPDRPASLLQSITTTTEPFVEVAIVPHNRMADKCVLGDPACGPLHESAVMLMGELKDALSLLEAKAKTDAKEHEDAMQEFNAQMQMILETKTAMSTQLAGATSRMNAIEAELELVEAERRELRKKLKRRREECTRGVREILGGEICHLRSLRNSVVSMSTQLSPADIVDCEVSDWLPGECSARCDNTCPNSSNGKPCGGMERMTREVIEPPSQHGTPCPPLQQEVACNQVKCPVDCSLSMWSGWSACSRQCGGGVRQRTRSVLQEAKYGGMACDSSTETQPCSTESCDRDCELSPWTNWGRCTAACGGGFQSQQRLVYREPAEGGDKCPSEWSHSRHRVRACNTQPCIGDERCLARQDLIIAVDTSASLGDGGLDRVASFTRALIAGYDFSSTVGFFAADGVPSSTVGGDQATICAPASHQAAGIACCSDDDSSCQAVCSSNPSSQAEARQLYTSYEDATARCTAQGRRLCTRAELQANVCQDAGCLVDQVLVWTSDLCAAELADRTEPPRVGIIQFGNGEVMADGSVSAARELSPLDSDLSHAQSALQSLNGHRGFSNLAQALVLAERLFQQRGRRSAEAVVLVIAKGRPPFGLHAQQKARELWDAGIRIVVVCLEQFENGKDAIALKKLASRPEQANFLHVPGVLTLQAGGDPTPFAQRVLPTACPHSVSPELEERRAEAQGFRLLREGQACRSSLASRVVLGKRVADAQGCNALAQSQNFGFFSYGTGFRLGECYGEAAACASEDFEGPSSTDFYQRI